jgi:hypothetical protein
MRRMQTTVITGQFENALTNEHVQLNDKVPNLAFFRNKIEQDEDIADKLDCVDFLRHFWGGQVLHCSPIHLHLLLKILVRNGIFQPP